MAKSKRPKIPERIVMQLWNSTAGRCQMEGCFKPLWTHGLTFARVKIGQMAHIIGHSCVGPRGNEHSEELSVNYENLMLLCGDCHKLVDDEEHVSYYPAELLTKMKYSHEEKVETLLALADTKKSRIISLRSCFAAENPPMITFDTVREALLRNDSHYPDKKSDNINIDTTAFSYSLQSCLWKPIQEKISTDLQESHFRDCGTKSLSIFAIAPIPLLIHLGRALPKTMELDVYQRDRLSGIWSTTYEEAEDNQISMSTVQTAEADTRKILLLVEVSAEIDMTYLPTELTSQEVTIFKIATKCKRPGIALSKSTIHSFKQKWLDFQLEVVRDFGHDIPIHIIAAIPNAIAVHMGNIRMEQVCPLLHLYEFEKEKKTYNHVLTI